MHHSLILVINHSIFNSLSYRIGDKNTGEMRVRMPCNPLLFGEPFAVSNVNFGKLWSYYKNKREQYFNMDLSRVANL
jgi:hypothetical protein